MSDNRVQIIVRTTIEEKEKIKEIAKSKNKSMNQLILDSVIDSDDDSTIDSTDDSTESVKDSSFDKTIITVFKDQLENKDKQIDKLQKLLDQQQQLSLQANKHIEKLQLQLSNEAVEDMTRSASNNLVHDSVENITEVNEKKGFFGRLFKNNFTN